MPDTSVDHRQGFKRARDALAEEHREIMNLIDTLERTPDSSKMIPRLERLHNLLINHFAHEQFPGGLYESMGAFGSRWHDLLRELIREHCLILSETRSLLDEARRCAPDERKDLQFKVVAVIRRLNEHEHKEHTLASNLESIHGED